MDTRALSVTALVRRREPRRRALHGVRVLVVLYALSVLHAIGAEAPTGRRAAFGLCDPRPYGIAKPWPLPLKNQNVSMKRRPE